MDQRSNEHDREEIKPVDKFGFIHHYFPSEDPRAPDPGALDPGALSSGASATILLLHGTGGSENDLLSAGRTIAPSANILSLRGNVLEGQYARFFRRHAEGILDEPDIRRQSVVLRDFLRLSSEVYGFSLKHLYAIGYSNGANMAAAMLLLEPESLAGAALWRSMLPIQNLERPYPNLTGKQVLMLSGQSDPMVPLASAESLRSLLTEMGANVQHEWQATGHNLVRSDIETTRDWMRPMLNPEPKAHDNQG